MRRTIFYDLKNCVCFFCLVWCARISVQAGPFLSHEQCGELAEAFRVYRSALNGLATEALDQGLLR